MKRSLFAVTALCGAALILTPLGIASAQGPVDCTEASALVVTAQADVAGLTADLDVQVAGLDRARFLLANATGTAVPFFQGEVRRLDGVVAALRVDLDEATAALAVAVTGRDEACVDPTPTTTPTTPAPTTEPTVEPTPEPTLSPAPTTPDDDSDFSDVGTAPRGGVATGG